MHLIEDVKAKFSSPVSKDKSRAPASFASPATAASSSGETQYSYTCNLCTQVFMDSEGWRAHKGTHGNKTWKCKYCSLLLEDRSQLATHITDTHSIARGETSVFFNLLV